MAHCPSSLRLGKFSLPLFVVWFLFLVLALGVSRQIFLFGRNLGGYSLQRAAPSRGVVEQIINKIPLNEQGQRIPIYLQYLDLAYLPLTVNWVCNVKEFGAVLNRTIFVSFDRESFDALHRLSLSFTAKGKPPLLVVLEPYQKGKRRKKDVQYGNSQYFSMMLFRTRMELMLLEEGVEFFLVESDATWHKDPSELVFGLEGDIVALNDAIRVDEFIINHGFSSFRPRPRVLEFFRELASEQASGKRSGDEANEQYIMQRLLANRYTDLNVTFLSPELFCNGQQYLNLKQGFNPWVRHNNFIIGTKAKIFRAKQAGYWYVSKDGRCMS